MDQAANTRSAVLTGDLVQSTLAGPEAVDRTMQTLKDAAAAFEGRGNLGQPLGFTRHRGDGWQVAVQRAGLSFRLVTFLLATLRASDPGLDTRIGIGFGSIHIPATGSLAGAHGSAFVNSGRALDSLGKSRGLALAPANSGAALVWLEAGLQTLTWLSGRWSVEQAEAVALLVTDQDATLQTLAARLGITRQALSARLAVAGEKPIMAAIRAAEATL